MRIAGIRIWQKIINNKKKIFIIVPTFKYSKISNNSPSGRKYGMPWFTSLDSFILFLSSCHLSYSHLFFFSSLLNPSGWKLSSIPSKEQELSSLKLFNTLVIGEIWSDLNLLIKFSILGKMLQLIPLKILDKILEKLMAKILKKSLKILTPFP